MAVVTAPGEDLKDTDRIAGWLVLPALGLIIGLGRDLLETLSAARSFVAAPGLETALPLVLLAPWIAFSVVVAAFFFRRHRWSRYLFIAFLLGNLAFAALYMAIHSFAPDPSTSDAPKELMRAIVGTLIWIPYFLRSRRAKLTFVRSW